MDDHRPKSKSKDSDDPMIWITEELISRNPLKIRKIRNITDLKKCLVELLIYIWH